MSITSPQSPSRLRSLLTRVLPDFLITPLYSIGSGLLTAVSVYSLPFLMNLSRFFLFPLLALVFIAETAVHIFIFRGSVKDTSKELLETGLFSRLNRKQKIILGLGLPFALSGGLALGALTFNSALFAFPLLIGLFSTAVPPFGLVIAFAAVLGGVTFLAYSALLSKYIKIAIEFAIHKKIALFFKEIITPPEDKPLAQHVLESFFRFFFISLIVLISFVGTLAGLATMQRGLKAFFLLVPHANILAAAISSYVIAFFFTGCSRFPLILQWVTLVFNKIGKATGFFFYHLGVFLKGCFSIFLHHSFNAAFPLVKKAFFEFKKPFQAVFPPFHIKDFFLFFLKLAALSIHALSFGVLAAKGGGPVIHDVLIKVGASGSDEKLNEIGQGMAIGFAATMAGTLSTKSFFFQDPYKKSVKTKQEEEIKSKEEIELDEEQPQREATLGNA